jgi:uncharacterized beta-barrel protein YwiB (DUF1934 family)
MNVWISIKGIQYIDDESQSIEFSTEGTFEQTENGYRLTYQESQATGMEGVTTSMIINPSAITLERVGAMNSLMILEKGRRTVCNYDTGFGSIMMGVYTREISSELSENGGELYFHYTLDINSDMASSHDIFISVRTTDSYPNTEDVKNQVEVRQQNGLH